MTINPTIWLHRFQTEIELAKNARAAGNEGRARVCARRAAGIVVGEYLERRKINFPNPSAYDRLKFLASLPETSPAVREASTRLLLRVSEDFALPEEVDLITEALWLAKELLENQVK